MDDKLKDLISEVAHKNGVTLSAKDPIMVLFTALEFLMERQEAGQKKMTSELRSSMEEVTSAWAQSLYQQSEELVTEHVATTQVQAKNLAKILLQETDQRIEERIEQAVKDLENRLEMVQESAQLIVERRIQETRFTAFLNLAAAAIVMLAVVVMVFKFTFES